jgi:site-specific DNA recombinase
VPPLRLVGYVRVSRVAGREGESFISPDVQRERIAKLADLRGHAVIEWVEDLDQSGAKWERPGLQRALEMVEHGEADGVAVAKLDRLARSVVDGGMALRRLQEAGGSLVLVEEGLDTSTPAGRAMMTILLAFAELELDRIRDSWADARERAIRRGVHITRVPPVGYRRAGDGRLEPDPETAPVVREVFRRRAEGTSWSDLCAFLDERLPRENGGRWTRGTVTWIIQNRTYLGEARAGTVVNANAHPPLVARAKFEAARSKTGRLPRRENSSLLQGIIRCAACGHTLTSMSDGRRGYSNYRCRKRHSDGICPDPAGISVSRADRYVQEQFLIRYLNAVELTGEIAVVEIGARTDDGVDAAERALEAAEAELVAYRDAQLISVIGQEAFAGGLRERARAVEEARQALVAAHPARLLALPSRTFADPDFGAPGRYELLTSWPAYDVWQRRAILAAAIDSVVCGRSPRRGKGSSAEERLTINWRDAAWADLDWLDASEAKIEWGEALAEWFDLGERHRRRGGLPARRRRRSGGSDWSSRAL